jgi:transcriptional regulator with XRE-family HTH domain
MVKNPLTLRREKRGLSQEQMAVLLKTCQSEISKTEAGEMPEDVAEWAKAYRVSKKKFREECEAAVWVLPLWRHAVSTPREIEHIDCRPDARKIAQ